MGSQAVTELAWVAKTKFSHVGVRTKIEGNLEQIVVPGYPLWSV